MNRSYVKYKCLGSRGFAGAASMALMAAVALVAAPAEAAMVNYGEAADFTGSRSVGSGLAVSGSHPSGDWSDVTIGWEITAVGDLFEYEYTFSDFGPPAISHITLDLTDDAVSDGELADPYAITDLSIGFEEGGGVSYLLEYGNKDGIDGSVKFDDFEISDNDEGKTVVISFTSNRAPVWGDIFVKGGQLALTNSGFVSQVSQDMLGFIARPNGQGMTVIPTPAALSMGLVGLMGLMLRRPTRSRG